ncbi:hypothetical protein EDD15DRAFT_2520123 [Pisolithus albus]|nr:hypothetical protein EDD15DRAFT_2520123 [Pisolithus albus]
MTPEQRVRNALAKWQKERHTNVSWWADSFQSVTWTDAPLVGSQASGARLSRERVALGEASQLSDPVNIHFLKIKPGTGWVNLFWKMSCRIPYKGSAKKTAIVIGIRHLRHARDPAGSHRNDTAAVVATYLEIHPMDGMMAWHRACCISIKQERLGQSYTIFSLTPQCCQSNAGEKSEEKGTELQKFPLAKLENASSTLGKKKQQAGGKEAGEAMKKPQTSSCHIAQQRADIASDLGLFSG